MVRNPALPETFCREEVMEAGAGEVPVDGFVFGGIVVKGNQLGRTIGFPTANLETATVLPAGVFACRVKILENASGQGKPEEPGSPDISGRSQSCPKRFEGLESTLDSRSPASPGCPPEGTRIRIDHDLWRVNEINILSRMITLTASEGRTISVPFEEISQNSETGYWEVSEEYQEELFSS